MLDSLRPFLARLEVGTPAAPDLSAERRALSEIEKQLTDLDSRLRRTFELVEDGTYTREIFLSRQAELTAERERLTADRTAIQHKIEQAQHEYDARTGLAPAVRHVLDTYNTDLPAADRNKLLKQVIDRIDYHKRTRTRWTKESDLSLTLHPVVFSSTTNR